MSPRRSLKTSTKPHLVHLLAGTIGSNVRGARADTKSTNSDEEKVAIVNPGLKVVVACLLRPNLKGTRGILADQASSVLMKILYEKSALQYSPKANL